MTSDRAYPTIESFRTAWARATDEQRQRLRDKARWEQMGLWAVANEWPGIIPLTFAWWVNRRRLI